MAKRFGLWLSISTVLWLWGNQPTYAKEWSHGFSVPATLEYDSNPTFAVANPTGVWRERVAPVYTLTGDFGLDQFKANLGLRLERSSNQAQVLSRNDPDLSVAWRRQNLLGEFGLSARHEAASIRASELTESGVLLADGTRTTNSISGNWRSALSAFGVLAATADYRKVTFDKGATPNYGNASAGLTYIHAWSQFVEPFVQLTASQFVPANTAPLTLQRSAQAGVRLTLWEGFDTTWQAGRSVVRSNGETAGWIWSGVTRYSTPRTLVSINVGRSIRSTPEAGLLSTDQLGGAWSYLLAARTRLGVDASWSSSTGTTGSTTRRAMVWMAQELSPFWNSRLYVQRTERVSNLGIGSASVLGITFTYSHPDF